MSDNDILKGLQILVVEDERDTRELLGIVLESEGANVALTDSVPAALDKLKTMRPDVIVADIGMPEYNGYALIAALRRDGNAALRRTPVIALTAFATAADRDTALVSGFNLHLTKPFDPEELVEAVRGLYDHRLDSAA